jgi:hypothetical protein
MAGRASGLKNYCQSIMMQITQDSVNARASSIYDVQQDGREAVRNKQRLPYQERIWLKKLAQIKQEEKIRNYQCDITFV